MENRSVRLTKILKALLEFHKEESVAFLKVALRKGATYQEIADELGVTKQAVQQKYRHIKA